MLPASVHPIFFCIIHIFFIISYKSFFFFTLALVSSFSCKTMDIGLQKSFIPQEKKLKFGGKKQKVSSLAVTLLVHPIEIYKLVFQEFLWSEIYKFMWPLRCVHFTVIMLFSDLLNKMCP